MNYPHQITVYRPAGNADPTPIVQDPDTGHTADSDLTDDNTTVWTGRCDVQDIGEVLKRDPAGQPVLESDATCFLAKERAVTLVEDGDLVTITWEDQTTSDAQVLSRRRLDGVLALRRL
jgi:hypothetical protein